MIATAIEKPAVTEPAATDIVNVIAMGQPQMIWVVCNGVIHSAKWGSRKNIDYLRDVDGNSAFMLAALRVWAFRDCGLTFTLSFSELERHAKFYGCSSVWS